MVLILSQRHILVKGCGKQSDDAHPKDDRGRTPVGLQRARAEDNSVVARVL